MTPPELSNPGVLLTVERMTAQLLLGKALTMLSATVYN